MKIVFRLSLVATALILDSAHTTVQAQVLPTNGRVETRLGTLELENGYPTAPTVQKVFDTLDLQRACQAYLWALPLMAMQQWQNEHLTKFEAGKCDYVDYLTFQDKLGLLTANATTPYIMAFPNLEETGPLVFEIPAGPTAGGFTDFWQRPITDSGQTGPDKGAGGKYLILGPDDPMIEPEGYYVFRSPTVNIWSAHRALDPDAAKARALIDGLKIYPYRQRENPPPTRHVSPNGRKWSGTQPRGLAYWEGLAKIINEEPVHERDRMIMGMLQPLGIEKGKPFQPTPRQKQILEEAAQVGEVMARTIAYQKRFEGATVWPGKHWEISLFLKETSQEAPHHTQFDERTSWFYEAVGVSVGMMGRTVGFGQLYLETAKDQDGNWLNGSHNYHLRVPKDAPVAQFWSVTVYDNETRCFVDTGVQPDRSSRDKIVKNDDGSVDLYFGPSAPMGKPKSNWIQTLPGKGWFSYFRLYGPTQAYFDRTWVLPDIERTR
ncbi:MAG: DUF1254 domain-containing protein [Planctomycetaceae bacterium]|jgi:hypothetical protein